MTPTLQVSFGGQSVFNGNKEVQSFSIGYDEILQLLQQQQTIETSLLHAIRNLRSDEETFVHLNNSLIGVRAHIERLYLCIPAIERPATAQSAAKAQEVFSTPELLEEIMMYLPTPEKLRAMGVQRCWRDGLNGSIRLRRSLGLAPFEKATKNYYSAFSPRVNNPNSADWRLANSNSPIGFFEDQDYINTHSNRGHLLPHLDDTIEAGPVDSSMAVRSVSYFGTNLNFGSRIRTMLLTSGPTLLELVPYIYCEPCSQQYRRGPTRFDPISPKSKSGFTIGELADRIAELRVKHPNCQPLIEFRGLVRLSPDDPIMTKRQEMYDRDLAQRILSTQEDDSTGESSDDSDSSDGDDEQDEESEDGGQEVESDSGDESASEEENEHGGRSDGDEGIREFSDDEEDEHE